MRNDLRTAIRSFRRSPRFTAVALIVLAFGIGAGTAVFWAADTVVLHRCGFDEHDRLGVVLEHNTRQAVRVTTALVPFPSATLNLSTL
jgi:hypothetical protein